MGKSSCVHNIAELCQRSLILKGGLLRYEVLNSELEHKVTVSDFLVSLRDVTTFFTHSYNEVRNDMQFVLDGSVPLKANLS